MSQNIETSFNKNYIKLNDNDFHLSLGNFIRIIKERSNSKISANQIDLFLLLFPGIDASDKSINHYCTGFRNISDEAKRLYIEYQKKSIKGEQPLIDIIKEITVILDGANKYYANFIVDLKTHPLWREIGIKLCNIAKNDSECSKTFQERLDNLLNSNDIYTLLEEIIYFCILIKKQPIYEKDEFLNHISQITSATGISLRDVEEVIKLNLSIGRVPFSELKSLAEKGNIYACKQMGSFEYYGMITGKPRYIEAYKYYLKASNANYAIATWMIGVLYDSNCIGENLEENERKAWEYYNLAAQQNCSSAINSIGIYYLNGKNPGHKKDIQKAKEYFKMAAEKGNIYSLNNLGKLYEGKDDKKSFNYYLRAANLEESWACNRIGECYRLGIGVERNIGLAYQYYLLSSKAPLYELCYWSKYNLARYFYENGNIELGIEKDADLAKKYYMDALNNGIDCAKERIDLM